MKLTLRRRQILWAYFFLSVSLVFFVTIRWYPTLLAFNISFRDWNVFQGAGPWVGWSNYADVWEDFLKPKIIQKNVRLFTKKTMAPNIQTWLFACTI